MSEKPIIFSSEMIKALLNGTKTMTRRVVKPQPEEHSPVVEIIKDWKHSLKGEWFLRTAFYGQPCSGTHLGGYMVKPPYAPNDVLWCRETWAPTYITHENGKAIIREAIYRADTGDFGERWHSPLHMPRVAARLFLRVTDVRIEKLREISPKDKVAEGFTDCCRAYPCNEKDTCKRLCFMRYWDSRNAKRGYGWDTNPLVWVISFERTERP